MSCSDSKKIKQSWGCSWVFLYCSRAVKLQPLLPPTGQRKNCRQWHQHQVNVLHKAFSIFFYWWRFGFHFWDRNLLKEGSIITTQFQLYHETHAKLQNYPWEKTENVFPLLLGFLHFMWKLRLDVDWKKVYAIAKMTFRWWSDCMLPQQGHWKVVPSALLTKLFRCPAVLRGSG